jgi:hypothetical protein
MKKLMMIALVVFFGNVLMAQTPDNVKTTFKTKYPNAQGVTWKSEKNNQYRVNYMDNSTRHAIVYDKDGNVVSEEAVITKDAVPASISDYYKTRTNSPNDADYTVWQVKDKNGNTTYYSEYQGKTSWFDKNGNITTRKDVATGDDIQIKDDKMPVDK